MNNPEYTDPIAHLDFAAPRIEKVDGGLLIDLEPQRAAVLERYFAHLATVEKSCGKLNSSDDARYSAVASRLEDLVEKDMSVLDLAEGDTLQITGLDYFMYQDCLHEVGSSSDLTCRYIDFAINPNYDIHSEEPIETSSTALHLAVEGITELSADKELEVVHSMTPGSFALISLQSLDLQLGKFVP